jgi:hypothetical protein
MHKVLKNQKVALVMMCDEAISPVWLMLTELFIWNFRIVGSLSFNNYF